MNQHTTSIPVVAIDGPTASGKGTVSALLAQKLGFHYLDSGAIYRVLAVAVMYKGLDPEDSVHLEQITNMAPALDVEFIGTTVLLDANDVSSEIRTEEAGVMASRLAAIPDVRAGLLKRQQDFRQSPGLVADGRDMASVVFPDALVKVFLTASAQVRAQRRYKQLLERGVKADYEQLVADLQARDKRDSERTVAPLKPDANATVIDCSELTIDEVISRLVDLSSQVGLESR